MQLKQFEAWTLNNMDQLENEHIIKENNMVHKHLGIHIIELKRN